MTMIILEDRQRAIDTAADRKGSLSFYHNNAKAENGHSNLPEY